MTAKALSDPTPAPIALVTGARRGIGAGIAGALARAGFDLVLLDQVRDAAAESVLATIAGLGRRGHFITADIGDIEGRAALVQQAFDCLGPVDFLVNNAGVQVDRRGDLLDVEPASFDRVMDINLRGTFFLTQAVARQMLARTSAAPHPRSIITISSINATVASIERAEYCLSKAALSMLVRQFAVRLAPAGIAAWEIRPGLIRTDMTAPVRARYDGMIADGMVPMPRWGEPDDIGRTVAALAQGLIPYATGEIIHVDGGLRLPR